MQTSINRNSAEFVAVSATFYLNCTACAQVSNNNLTSKEKLKGSAQFSLFERLWKAISTWSISRFKIPLRSPTLDQRVVLFTRWRHDFAPNSLQIARLASNDLQKAAKVHLQAQSSKWCPSYKSISSPITFLVLWVFSSFGMPVEAYIDISHSS